MHILLLIIITHSKEHHHVLECQDSMMTLLVDRMASYQPQRVGFHIEVCLHTYRSDGLIRD